MAPSRSPLYAGLTHALGTVPVVSTGTWHFTPDTLFERHLVAIGPVNVYGTVPVDARDRLNAMCRDLTAEWVTEAELAQRS